MFCLPNSLPFCFLYLQTPVNQQNQPTLRAVWCAFGASPKTMKRSFKTRGAKHKKLPVPRKAVWWLHLDRHPVYSVLGSVIRSMRTIRGWSLRDVHRGTKLAFSYLSNLEKGRYLPSIEVIMRLEAVFRLKRGTLLARAYQKLEGY